MGSLLKRFVEDGSGANGVAYALVVAAISLAIITVAHSLAAPLRDFLAPTAVEVATGDR